MSEQKTMTDEILLNAAKKIKEHCQKSEVGGHCPFGKNNICLGSHDCLLSGVDEPSPAEDWYVPTKEEVMGNDSRKPLTLEKLRNMDGLPVFHKKTGKWYTVELHMPDFGECILDRGKFYFLPLKIAEKDGLYSVEPPRLDRSAWETCMLCVVGDWKHLEYSFCPYCGRPLTDAAWEMLERRLEGRQ